MPACVVRQDRHPSQGGTTTSAQTVQTVQTSRMLKVVHQCLALSLWCKLPPVRECLLLQVLGAERHRIWMPRPFRQRLLLIIEVCIAGEA